MKTSEQVLYDFLEKREEQIRQLRLALRDCMDYVDVDNLTMQTKYEAWLKALNEGKEEE